MTKPASLIPADTRLKNKARHSGILLNEASIARATLSIRRFAEDHVGGFAKQVSNIDKTLARIETQKPSQSQKLFESLFNQSHDVRGLGGTFGYPLIGRVAAMLCAELRRLPVESADLAYLRLHVDLMKIILSRKMRDKDPAGEELVAELDKIRADKISSSLARKARR